jgi:L-aspartate oxidase
MLNTDYLVIGSGVAGLSAAFSLSQKIPGCSVTIVTKLKICDSATILAQGGMAAVMDQESDSFTLHINDTLKAGDGLCNRDSVEKIIHETPQRINDLIMLGAHFDRDGHNALHLALEGGHSRHRIVHRADFTGKEISDVLIRNIRSQKNISILEDHFTLELLTGTAPDGAAGCAGALVLNNRNNKVFPVLSGATILATGGVGQVFEVTTNPALSTGDGIAMAGRIGALLEKMEFFQFHPTALYETHADTAFLISEAVRGAGGILRNKKGARFMRRYDQRGDLASRDIVSRAIRREIEHTGSQFVFLDCRLIPEPEFITHFPTIYNKCLSCGINPSVDLIPVRPAAHYCCGGIRTDMDGRTNISGLYAVGECSSTGMHGANRLASNSLTEALVLANRNSDHIKRHGLPMARVLTQVQVPMVSTAAEGELYHLKKELQASMSSIGVICTNAGIEKNLWRLDHIFRRIQRLKEAGINVPLIELENLAFVSKHILQSSLMRKQNCGTFFKICNIDFKYQVTPDFNLAGA